MNFQGGGGGGGGSKYPFDNGMNPSEAWNDPQPQTPHPPPSNTQQFKNTGTQPDELVDSGSATPPSKRRSKRSSYPPKPVENGNVVITSSALALALCHHKQSCNANANQNQDCGPSGCPCPLPNRRWNNNRNRPCGNMNGILTTSPCCRRRPRRPSFGSTALCKNTLTLVQTALAPFGMSGPAPQIQVIGLGGATNQQSLAQGTDAATANNNVAESSALRQQPACNPIIVVQAPPARGCCTTRMGSCGGSCGLGGGLGNNCCCPAVVIKGAGRGRARAAPAAPTTPTPDIKPALMSGAKGKQVSLGVSESTTSSTTRTASGSASSRTTSDASSDSY